MKRELHIVLNNCESLDETSDCPHLVKFCPRFRCRFLPTDFITNTRVQLFEQCPLNAINDDYDEIKDDADNSLFR